MAENRFSKGVKAAKERTAEIEAQKNLNQEVIEQPVVKETSKKQTEDKKQSENDSSTKLDISKIFSDTPKKKKALAKTFNMSEANMEKLEKLAKSQKMSVSKVLNEILSNVL